MHGLYYTGVGSRKTPKTQCDALRAIAYRLACAGYTVRSGGAEGADTAFEDGAKQHLIRSPKQFYDIYLPWDGFEGRRKGFNHHTPEDCPPLLWQKATEMAKDVHPKWENCSRGDKTLHTRNVFQVLGHALDTPSLFLICWAEVDRKGIPTGGTATAWRIAKEHNVPCYNINTTFDLFELEDFLLGLKV